MIASIEYAAALAYSPRGQSAISQKSRQYRDALKRADARFLAMAAAHIAQQVQKGQFQEFFGAGITLVPVPGSAPRRDPSSLWIAEQLCRALMNVNLGAQVWSGLRRETAVPKSATASRGERPTIDVHIESLRMNDYLAPTGVVTLVDDVITKGRTLLACAEILQRSIPSLTIRGFALIRTMGLVPDIAEIVDPVVGNISFDGDAVRAP